MVDAAAGTRAHVQTCGRQEKRRKKVGNILLTCRVARVVVDVAAGRVCACGSVECACVQTQINVNEKKLTEIGVVDAACGRVAG